MQGTSEIPDGCLESPRFLDGSVISRQGRDRSLALGEWRLMERSMYRELRDTQARAHRNARAAESHDALRVAKGGVRRVSELTIAFVDVLCQPAW